MINVPIDKIIPLTTARDSLSKIVSEVEAKTPLYVLTKGGKPSVAVVNIEYLEKALGGQLIGESESTNAATLKEAHEPTLEPEELTDQPTLSSTLSESTPPPPLLSPPPAEPSSKSVQASMPPSPSTNTPPTPPPKSTALTQIPPNQPPPSSTPPLPPPTSPPATTTTAPPVALGSMDGIQPKPFIEPQPPPPAIDPNMTPNSAQYAGSMDVGQNSGTTQTTNPTSNTAGTDDLPDMVID